MTRERLVVQQGHGGAVLPPQLFRVRLDRGQLVLLARQHRQLALREQVLEAVPVLKAQEHIRPQQEEERAVGIPLPQGGDGIRAVTAAPAPERQIRHLDTRHVPERKAAERKPRLEIGAPLLQLLMRRHGVRRHEEEVRAQLLAHGLRGGHMPRMGRVEAAAV